ncbi:20436_t:CDS:2 [Entrophospora sp. SA101]|nr:7253_t:CDS:2 [Entrophospora sp. SA101]CAJ0761386.1 20436_t:CDS:2 [Entrophospora sp. SA101]CAJ0882520.1 10665_t:CDS:2 [Entrophospora sp. SA101]
MGKKTPNKRNIAQPKKLTGGGGIGGIGSLTNLTSAQDIKNTNNIVSVETDTQELTLALNEQEFNLKKQQLVSKIQDAISKCQVSRGLKKKMQNHLDGLQAVQPIHQKEILELEAELREAETKYNDAMANAAKETDPAKKAQFIAIAQEAANTIKQVKAKLTKNPLSKLTEYSYLNDIGRMLGGNLPNNPPTVPGNGSGGSGSGDGGSGNDPNGGGGGGSSGGTTGSQQPNQQQLILIAVAALVVIFLLMSQKDSSPRRSRYDDYY